MTLNEIQSQIAAYLDQDQDTANISTADYALRLSYINRALMEWGEQAVEYKHRALYKEYNMRVSTATGNASIVIPSDFRKLASFPVITYDGVSTKAFPETTPETDTQYGANDKRMWILGNPNTGYVMRVFGTTLASGASVMFPYYSSPASLVSPANIAEIPNPQFLVQRGLHLLLESREDERFPIAKSEADRTLANILEFEQTESTASSEYRVKTAEETRHGNFRMGID